MRTGWVLLIALLSFALGSCGGSSRAAVKQSPEMVLLESPSQEPISDSPMSDPSLPQLLAPTIGSVVITNTTATPLSITNSASALTPDPAFQGLIQQAKEDLAKRLSIDVNQVGLQKVVPAAWPYDRLGCPLPDNKNADSNTQGYQILLIANDEMYAYHIEGQDLIGLCIVKPPNEIRTLP